MTVYYDSKKRFKVNPAVRIFKDLKETVLEDKWVFIVIWGKQRLGKSTLALWCAYYLWRLLDPTLSEDDLWERVYRSVVFNLSQLLYKIRDPSMDRVWDRKKHHQRIPIFLWDDFGANSNKAITQHDIAWDYFKGGFDVLGTKFGCIIATMTTPEQPTSQIEHKYTAEIVVVDRGVYKYDIVEWHQDYRGWNAKHGKDWQQIHTFKEIPWERFEPYDELRNTLADEVLVNIEDAMSRKIPHILRRTEELDLKILDVIKQEGPTSYDKLILRYGDPAKSAIRRLKAHQLVSVDRRAAHSYYDLTGLGLDVYAEAIKGEQEKTKATLTKAQQDTPQIATLQNIAFKKQFAETLRFQSLRVTESYGKDEPDIVVWENETTPKEVVSIKVISALPAILNIEAQCANEIAFAKKYGLEKIRLICYDGFKKDQIHDGPVNFDQTVRISGGQVTEIQQIEELEQIVPLNKVNSLIFNKSFRTSPVEITDRVVAVSDAFGIGVDEQREFTIFDNVELKYDDSDLIYVTGDSGSGKSTFLKIFEEHELLRGRKCVNFDSINPEPTEVLIDSLGKTRQDAMRILGTVGLSEAFLMVRQYRELSDGQKYRYRLGKAIDIEAETYLIDEFGAKLDREMAKTLAFCIQKWARRNQKTLLIATTHRDLKEDFNANIVFDRRFGEQSDPQYFKPKSPSRFSLIKEMQIEPATKQDYDALKQFHYLHGSPPTSHRYKITHNGRPIGVILYGPSFLGSHYRSERFPEYKMNPQKINAEILRITRIIIHPKYRGVGLAQELIRLTMPLVNKRIIETIAAMAQYNPFFEKAGMTYVGKQKFVPSQERLIKFVEEKGANVGLLQDHNFRKGFLNKLDQQGMTKMIDLLQKLVDSMKGVSKGRWAALTQDLLKGDIEKVMVKVLPVERVYLYWLNPNWSE